MNKIKKYNPNDYRDEMMSKLLNTLLEEQIIVIAMGIKGGSGKSTIAKAWLISILKAIRPESKVQFIEIYQGDITRLNADASESVSSYKYIKINEAEKEIDLILRDGFLQKNTNVCIDAGNVRDSMELLKLINKMDLKKKVNKIVYVIPFNSSYMEMDSVRYLAESGLLEDNTVLYACNKVNNMIEYKKEFVHFFGNNLRNEDHIEGIAKSLGIKDTDVLLIPNSPYYEKIDLKNGMNIFDYAKISLNSKLEDYIQHNLKKAEEAHTKNGTLMSKEEKRLLETRAIIKYESSSYVATFMNQHLPNMLKVFMTIMGKYKK